MKGTIYMIPCPIAEHDSVWEVLPKANLEVMNSLDYFIVENVRSARRFLSKAGIERKIDELEFVELNEIILPKSIKEIGESAIEKGTVIKAPHGSYAIEWAKQNNIKYEEI